MSLIRNSVTGLMMLVLLASPAEATGVLRGGAAMRRITPRVSPLDPPVYMAGFGHARVARGVHGDITVRALVLEQDDVHVALVAVDVVGLFAPTVRAIREALRRRMGENPPIDLFVCATHTHAGPDTMGLWGRLPWITGASRGYMRRLREAVVTCVLEAREHSRPVTLRVASVDVADRIRDTRPPEVIDGTMVVLTVEGEDSRCVATVTELSNHPEVLWGDNTILSADFPYFLRRRIEADRGGVALHFSGAVGGLMTPRHLEVPDPATGKSAPRGSLRACELYGEELAGRAVASLAGARLLSEPCLRVARAEVAIPLENWRFDLARRLGVVERKLIDGCVRSEVGVIDLGSLQLVAVPGELYPELWLGGAEHPEGADLSTVPELPALRRLVPGPDAMILGLCNDELGYIIPPGQWDREKPYTYGRHKAPYGEVNSVGPQAAIETVRGIERLGRKLFKK